MSISTNQYLFFFKSLENKNISGKLPYYVTLAFRLFNIFPLEVMNETFPTFSSELVGTHPRLREEWI